MSKTKPKYGSVDSGVWTHHDFKHMDDSCKLLFMYLRTCKHNNIIGCFELPILYVQADLKWTEKKALETLSKLSENGFAHYDERVEIVILPKHLVKHPLQNVNQAKGAARIFNEIPKKFKYYNDLHEYISSQETVSEGLSKGLITLSNTVTVTLTLPITPEVGSDEPTAPEVASFNFEESFNQFWKVWPKRGDTRKTAHEKLKTKCKNLATFELIMNGLNAQLPQFSAKENQHIPSASTWLNQERWLNDPEPVNEVANPAKTGGDSMSDYFPCQ